MRALIAQRMVLDPASAAVPRTYCQFGPLHTTLMRPFIALDGAGVRLQFFEDDGKERGFARAVRPDERDAFAVVELKRSVLKKSAPAESHFQIANDQHGIIMATGAGALVWPATTSRKGYSRNTQRQPPIWEEVS